MLLVATGALAGDSVPTVTIDAMRFQPATMTAKHGATIVWVNRDLVPHTVTAPRVFDSGPIAPGHEWRHVVQAPGRYEYVCTLHPTMKATLVVE